MPKYKIFYPKLGGGKYHTSDHLTRFSTCGNFLVDQRNEVSIHLQGAEILGKVHPVICKRCLKA